MTKFLRAAAVGLGLTLFAHAAPAGSALSGIDREELNAAIRDYIMAHPEVIAESMEILQNRMNAAAAAKEKEQIAGALDKLHRDEGEIILGNPKGDVTLVEFFDYNCHYCKQALGDVVKLMREDKNLRVVLKEYPILGPGSVEAATVAVAARRQMTPEQFMKFHEVLMDKKGPINKEVAIECAKAAGADVSKLDTAMSDAATQRKINESISLGRELGITGTPGFFVADEKIVGAVGFEAMKATVDSIRKCGKGQCG